MKLIKFLILLSLFLCTKIAKAESNSVTLVVELTDGSMHRYEAREKPIVQMNADALVVTVGDNSTEYPRSEFSHIYFTRETTAVNDVKQEKGQDVTFRYVSPDVMEVCTSNGGEVRIFSSDGTLCSCVPLKESYTEVDLSKLSSGIYVFKVNKKSIKFIKR